MNAATKSSVGAAAWLIFALAHVRDLRADVWAYALLLFAALVLVPLALDLFADEHESPQPARLFAWVRLAQLPAALLLVVAYWLEPGRLAVAAALPWGGVTALLAAVGVLRIRQAGLKRSLDGLCRDAALIFAAVGGAWTLADRGGFRPLDFDPAIVALTAVHFHYAGLLLPLFAGLVQRELWFLRFAARAAVGVILGVPAVAVGITVAQLGWGGSLEAAAGAALALAGMAVAILQVRIALEAKRPAAARTLLGIAGASLFLAMVLAGAYALRRSGLAFPWLGIPQMRMLHGTANALGFGLCGVLGWRRMALRPQPPLSS
jgi:hypothetical protein